MIQPLSDRRMGLVDRHLEGAVQDLLHHDARVADLRVTVRFSGGVAHVTGEVADQEPLRLLRELIGRFEGVLAVWDWVRVAGRVPVVLDLGCGGAKQGPGHIGVDCFRTKEVDLLADLGDGLPFASGSADRVFAVHVLEHLLDYLPLLTEIRRVLRPDGVLHVMSPWWRHVNAVADPTHLRFFDVQTIREFCRSDWYPLHAGCDGASVFADLAPRRGGAPEPDEVRLGRFFD
jgi:SAM-dependent methyltransferase